VGRREDLPDLFSHTRKGEITENELVQKSRRITMLKKACVLERTGFSNEVLGETGVKNEMRENHKKNRSCLLRNNVPFWERFMQKGSDQLSCKRR